MILLVTPSAPSTVLGNGVTAHRWETILRRLGHPVTTSRGYRPGDYRALVALHAVKSADAVRGFRAEHPHAPVIIALTGTDLYPDLAAAGVDPDVLHIASRFVVLHANAAEQLPAALRHRARVIVQSVPPIERRTPTADAFEVAFLAHLRPVKDPLRPALATRLLPASSRVLVTHLGEGLDPSLAAAAQAESERNPRYRWLGALPRPEALDVLARSRLLVLSSLTEGGANVVSEAIAAGVPVVSSRIAGSIGLLGENYPGYFEPGDAAGLADALDAAEHDRGGYYRRLRNSCTALRPSVDPATEERAWVELLTELALPVPV